MLSRIFAITLMMSMSVYAADECAPQVVDPGVLADLTRVSNELKIECPNQIDSLELCNLVSTQLAESAPNASTRFAYQTRIYRAACVDSSRDSAQVIQQKVQAFWNRYHDQLQCHQLGFSVVNGNILKLAVERNSREFINDAVRRWRVNLNHVDSTDQKTVLDYIQAELVKARGNNMEPVLQRYFTLFRSNGAKFQREL